MSVLNASTLCHFGAGDFVEISKIFSGFVSIFTAEFFSISEYRDLRAAK